MSYIAFSPAVIIHLLPLMKVNPGYRELAFPLLVREKPITFHSQPAYSVSPASFLDLSLLPEVSCVLFNKAKGNHTSK